MIGCESVHAQVHAAVQLTVRVPTRRLQLAGRHAAVTCQVGVVAEDALAEAADYVLCETFPQFCQCFSWFQTVPLVVLKSHKPKPKSPNPKAIKYLVF